MTSPADPTNKNDPTGLTDAAREREIDLALLAAGEETGWYDETGRPAPWPEDFFDPDSGWAPATNTDTPPPAPGEPPF